MVYAHVSQHYLLIPFVLLPSGGMQRMLKIPFIFVTFEDFGDMLTKEKETELGAI